MIATFTEDVPKRAAEVIPATDCYGKVLMSFLLSSPTEFMT